MGTFINSSKSGAVRRSGAAGMKPGCTFPSFSRGRTRDSCADRDAQVRNRRRARTSRTGTWPRFSHHGAQSTDSSPLGREVPRPQRRHQALAVRHLCPPPPKLPLGPLALRDPVPRLRLLPVHLRASRLRADRAMSTSTATFVETARTLRPTIGRHQMEIRTITIHVAGGDHQAGDLGPRASGSLRIA